MTGTQEELGKPIHSDEKNEKSTYVSLEGIEKATADVEQISQRALQNLLSLDQKNEFLVELIRSLITRKN